MFPENWWFPVAATVAAAAASLLLLRCCTDALFILAKSTTAAPITRIVNATPSKTTNKKEDQVSFINFSDSLEDPSTTVNKGNMLFAIF